VENIINLLNILLIFATQKTSVMKFSV
jgi:hypothetical protein